MSKNKETSFVGVTTYANGEREYFTCLMEFIQTIKNELPYRGTSGFNFEVRNADASTRKQIDDFIYSEYGERNPHDLAYYQEKEGK